MDRKEKMKWSKENVADAICQAVVRQNLCDYKSKPILVVDKNTERFLRRKYWLTTRKARWIISWAAEYEILKLHPISPVLLTPENASEPDVYYIAPDFYEQKIKPYLKEAPSNY